MLGTIKKATSACRGPASRLPRILLVSVCALWLSSASAFAGDANEVWPELGVFVTLNPRTRLFIDGPFTKGVDTEDRTMEFGAYVDVSLVPILRKPLLSKDWARGRYLWVRFGYTRIANVKDWERTAPENRAVFELRARGELPQRIWIEGRARTDFRWIGGAYSTRYRLRLEASREFEVRGHPVTPYLHAEWFYDTRYDGWSRHLVQAGAEVTATKHFRYELYVARQVGLLPSESAINALGIFLKWHF